LKQGRICMLYTDNMTRLPFINSTRLELPDSTMSVLFETSLGDLVIDLEVEQCPKTCENFLKLCKVYYYNLNAFFNGTQFFPSLVPFPSMTRMQYPKISWPRQVTPLPRERVGNQYGPTLPRKKRRMPQPTGILPQKSFRS
jgi:hypothetical protein